MNYLEGKQFEKQVKEEVEEKTADLRSEIDELRTEIDELRDQITQSPEDEDEPENEDGPEDEEPGAGQVTKEEIEKLGKPKKKKQKPVEDSEEEEPLDESKFAE